MTYRLYARRQTGSMAIEAALALAGIEAQVIDTPRPDSDAARAAFAAINPRLQVPVLIHPDGTVITEGPAILTHLADAHPQAGLIPPPGSSARALHDRWMGFFHANVYEGMLRELFADRYVTDPACMPSVASAATGYVRQHFRLFDTALAPGPFLFGDRLQVIDIYVWMLCWWMDASWLVQECPAVHRLWQAAGTRPELARVGHVHFG